MSPEDPVSQIQPEEMSPAMRVALMINDLYECRFDQVFEEEQYEAFQDFLTHEALLGEDKTFAVRLAVGDETEKDSYYIWVSYEIQGTEDEGVTISPTGVHVPNTEEDSESGKKTPEDLEGKPFFVPWIGRNEEELSGG